MRPRRIIEIGSDTGALTEQLVGWAGENGAVVVSIDPDPSASTRQLAERTDALLVVAEPSPAALAHVEPGEVWIIDGDHNYWTVSHELAQAFAGAGDRLALVHDVGWPCGRRDCYYDPESIPPESVHEHSWTAAIRPGEPGVADTGFSVPDLYAIALREGGPRNGVRTAVEDFLAERSGLRFAQIPALFGLGFVYPASAGWASALEALLEPLADSTLLATLEDDRLRNYLATL